MIKHRLQYGLEVEVVSSLIFDEKDIKVAISNLFPEYKIRRSQGYNDHKSKNTIYIYKDWSIVPNRNDFNKLEKIQKKELFDLSPVEIVFPIMNKRKTIETLEKIERGLFKTGLMNMNATCSIHVNVSFLSNNLNGRVDIGKLNLSFNTDKWLDYFKRKHNNFCKKSISKFDLDYSNKKSKNNKKKFLPLLNNRIKIKEDKYRAINTSEFYQNLGGRIEFRIAGGKKAMSSKTMIKFLNDIDKAMYKSINPNFKIKK